MNKRKPGESDARHRSGLVYSTDLGRVCPACRQAMNACACKALAKTAKIAASDGVVRVSRESKGRGGKTVTIVRGVPLEAEALASLGKRLRRGRHGEGRRIGNSRRPRRATAESSSAGGLDG